MGGRGGSSGTNGAGVTSAQNKAVSSIANKTRNLKNEQYRVINEDGEVVLVKKGGAHEVAATVGEKRDLLPGAVTIHNHPEGGTFSDSDLNEFGYGARQIVVASPEGTYKLTNMDYFDREKKFDKNRGWLAMRDAMDSAGITKERSFLDIRRQAQEVPRVKKLSNEANKTADSWVKARDAGASQDTLTKIARKYDAQREEYNKALREAERKVEVQPYHDFYRKNASKYGFKYEFTRN